MTESNVDVLQRALAFAFLTATDPPIVFAMPTVRKVAEVLDACGVSQTDVKKLDQVPPLPKWLRHGMAEAPDSPRPSRQDPAKAASCARVGKAPKPPAKRAAKKAAPRKSTRRKRS